MARKHKDVARQSRNQNPSRELRESSVAAFYARRRCRAHGSPAVIDRRYSRFRVIRGQILVAAYAATSLCSRPSSDLANELQPLLSLRKVRRIRISVLLHIGLQDLLADFGLSRHL